MSRAGIPTAVAPAGTAFADDGARADDGAVADRDAIQDLRACAQPDADADVDPRRPARLVQHRLPVIGEVVIAADQVRVRRDERVGTDAHAAGGKQLAIEPDVRAVLDLDVAVLAGQDRVAADEDAGPDLDAAVGRALGVEQAVVVDDHVVADVDLVRMPKDDVLAEDDVASAAAEQHRVTGLAERQPERARHALREQHDELVLDERRQAGLADDQGAVFGARPAAPAKELILRAWNIARGRYVRSIPAHGTTPACVRCPRAVSPWARSQAPAGRD